MLDPLILVLLGFVLIGIAYVISTRFFVNVYEVIALLVMSGLGFISLMTGFSLCLEKLVGA